jgi:hypothetical protein
MIKRIVLLLGTVVLVVVGASMFAAFESHVINVRAHVEKATYVTPDMVDFGNTLMQASYDADVQIHLSASFQDQTTYTNAEYSIYCDEKPQSDWAHDANITPFIVLTGEDGVDHAGCGGVALGANDPPVLWTVGGALWKGTDIEDTWHLKFYAPLCSDNYNPDTDPIDPATRPVPLIIDSTYCRKAPGMVDSDEYTDLASNIKFQITGFSVPTP